MFKLVSSTSYLEVFYSFDFRVTVWAPGRIDTRSLFRVEWSHWHLRYEPLSDTSRGGTPCFSSSSSSPLGRGPYPTGRGPVLTVRVVPRFYPLKGEPRRKKGKECVHRPCVTFPQSDQTHWDLYPPSRPLDTSSHTGDFLKYLCRSHYGVRSDPVGGENRMGRPPETETEVGSLWEDSEWNYREGSGEGYNRKRTTEGTGFSVWVGSGTRYLFLPLLLSVFNNKG